MTNQLFNYLSNRPFNHNRQEILPDPSAAPLSRVLYQTNIGLKEGMFL
jgi:hypothetical protein